MCLWNGNTTARLRQLEHRLYPGTRPAIGTMVTLSVISSHPSDAHLTGANCTTSPPSVTGNLLWTLSLVHLVSEYTGNTTIDTAVLCPVLGRALQFYQHFQFTNTTDGKVHLGVTFSPEYPGPPGNDANYDVSLYHWGLQTAIQLAEEHPTACGSPHLPAWKETLEKLTEFPVDPKSDTLEIYAGVPYGTPHRHYSHLFSIWPLHLLDVTNQTLYNTARHPSDARLTPI